MRKNLHTFMEMEMEKGVPEKKNSPLDMQLFKRISLEKTPAENVEYGSEGNIEDCTTPSLDEMWDAEGNIQDFWTNISDEIYPQNETDDGKEEKAVANTFSSNFEDYILSNCATKQPVSISDEKQSVIVAKNLKALGMENSISETNSTQNIPKDDSTTPVLHLPENSNKEKRKIWTIEQQRDPAAAEELYAMIVGYLSNY